MKKYFSLDITGDDCWKVILAWCFAILATILAPFLAFGQFMPDLGEDGNINRFFVILYISGLLNEIVNCIFIFVLLGKLLPRIKSPAERFAFHGDVGEYFKISVQGLVLAFVTSGFYYPWLLRNQQRYLAASIKINEKEISFNGQPAKLLMADILISLMILLVLLILPGLAFLSLVFPVIDELPDIFFPILIGAIIAAIFLLLIAFEIIALRWAVQFGSGDFAMHWKGKLVAATFFYMGQLLLLLITLGIAWPFVMVNSWHYWISRMEIKQKGVTAFRFGFVKDFHYFKMFWTQAILCIVTVGIYLPWAFAKIAGRMVELCYVEEVITEATTPAPTIEYQI